MSYTRWSIEGILVRVFNTALSEPGFEFGLVAKHFKRMMGPSKMRLTSLRFTAHNCESPKVALCWTSRCSSHSAAWPSDLEMWDGLRCFGESLGNAWKRIEHSLVLRSSLSWKQTRRNQQTLQICVIPLKKVPAADPSLSLSRPHFPPSKNLTIYSYTV